jgi:hypothetical protein
MNINLLFAEGTVLRMVSTEDGEPLKINPPEKVECVVAEVSQQGTSSKKLILENGRVINKGTIALV